MSEVVYSCRRCRSLLFKSSQVSTHEPGAHGFAAHRAAKDRRSVGGVGGSVLTTSETCTSLFLTEPVLWMAQGGAGGAAADGKLVCPGTGCGARLGALSWAGDQCSCGTWITPAIQFSKKALDARPVTGVAASLPQHVAMPAQAAAGLPP